MIFVPYETFNDASMLARCLAYNVALDVQCGPFLARGHVGSNTITLLFYMRLVLLLALQVSAHVNCAVQVTISGSVWFQVQGVAVEPYDTAIPMSDSDEAAIRKGR
jgi:hypothetical protein